MYLVSDDELSYEKWKNIDDFPGYQVSDLGRVRSKRSYGWKILIPTRCDNGYLKVCLVKNQKRYNRTIHRLVATAFIPNPENKPEVNHKNTNKKDNRVANLEWSTGSENQLHSAKYGYRSNSKPIQIIETGETFPTIGECARVINGNRVHIGECARKERDTHQDLHFDFIERSEQKRKPFLYDYQMDAVNRMRNGCVLCGQVGSGKSRTGLFYYFKEQGGWIDENGYIPMKNPKDLYIISTAKKRDSLEWNGELAHFLLSTDPKQNQYYGNKIVVDSWNNLPKYKDVTGAFFLLDEQRLVSYGSWTKSFLKIAKSNDWILLSATPGDSYLEYLPVFLANGFFRNKTEFNREHVIFSRYTKYPKIERYMNTTRLDRLRDRVLVTMDYEHKIDKYNEDVYCNYDISLYKNTIRNRWNPYKDEPIADAGGLCYVLRRIVNSDDSRQVKLLEILENHPRAIIFYNFNYEREILLNLAYGEGVQIAEWSGNAHQPVPDSERWVYICQYTAAAEGWECTKTNCVIFFSQNYSYKILTQAAGRIDRLNTPYKELYYYHLRSRSGIDLAISKALREKKKFNERKWTKWDR